ncbi:hypothetical protein NC652_011007 [Populus alba x Populus x berolinensis]|uniref:Uncharacterized protein n=1 Tax=Populus alba x Populus x berolinensis TaxID=444605 RepID=A0AAD6W608_9ROSI|nr:hypothetical protein NC652_011007 [Populus alba x Populus x berolinensis]KAJ7000487.1 hypothetical protein NC653_011075 [Populus alba x Populus x berolinensis]
MFINLLILFTERENTNYNEEEWRRKHFSIQLKPCRAHITLALNFLILFLFMAEIGRQDSPFSVKNGCRRPPKALPPRSTFQLAYLLPSSYTHHAACSHVGHG